MKTIPHIPNMPRPKTAGVYGIIHTETSRIYVGSTIDIPTRWKKHRRSLAGNTHYNEYLQRAWNKYGAEAFTWVVLEEVTDLTQLLPLEQKWIDYHQAAHIEKGFNLLPNAGRSLGRPYHPRPCSAKKLTDDEVRFIKARLARGDTCSEIAKEYNLHATTIQRIKTGQNWRHIIDFTPLPEKPTILLPPDLPPKRSRRRLLDIDDWYIWLETTFLTQ